MEAGFEAGTGAAEKVLGVKLPILMRIVLPGLLVTAVLYPPVKWLLGYLPSDSDHIWEPIAAYAVLVLLLGAIVSTGNSEIYKIYEGRMGWPDRLTKWAVKRQQARVDKLRAAAKAEEVKAKYDELWLELRAYPIDAKGDPEERIPPCSATSLPGMSNILAPATTWTRFFTGAASGCRSKRSRKKRSTTNGAWPTGS